MSADTAPRGSVFDPTGNITALVESAVEAERQSAVAAEIMRRFPEVEQLGFVRFPEDADVQAELRMAGGEFCGNASMCAAALFLLRRGGFSGAEERVLLRVSGAEAPVEVRLRAEADGSFRAQVRMPRPLEIGEREFAFGSLRGKLPLVRMQGISHILIGSESPFFALREDRTAAEEAVRAFCGELGAQCLGLMFLEGAALTPLVYVPGSGTVFWENSCASGSAAVGMALAAQSGGSVELELRQPGGVLRVASDPAGETWLCGVTRRVFSF